MKPPRLPEAPPPVLRDPELQRLVDLCERDEGFEGRRDEAILRVHMDTGARRGEILGLPLADVDLDRVTLTVTGEGSRKSQVGTGAQTVRAVDRYTRARGKDAAARLPNLWLGH